MGVPGQARKQNLACLTCACARPSLTSCWFAVLLPTINKVGVFFFFFFFFFGEPEKKEFICFIST